MQLPQEPTASQLRAELLAILRCTMCKAPLRESSEGYRCFGCSRVFPRVRDLVRFVDAEDYAESFGYQWHRYSQTQLDRIGRDLTENDFISKTGFSPEKLQGKLVLDVGCGMGRFAEVATRWGARVVGIDLSSAVELAVRNLAGREFVGFQADLFGLPFAPESFDIIYSLGVLHHTPDCEKAFKVLHQYLRPGGTVAIWLYSGYNKWFRFSDQYRKFTHRMSIRTLHNLLRIAVPVLYHLDRGLRVIPVLGQPTAGLIHHLFPVSRHPEPETRVLDTLDWYSPRYQSKHTYEEVFPWFESCGLEALAVAKSTLGIRGRKPLLGMAEASPDRTEPELRGAAALVMGTRMQTGNGGVEHHMLGRRVSNALRWLPSFAWQRLTRRVPKGRVHLILALADHFEPGYVPGRGAARAPYDEQERRLESWCRECPQVLGQWHDNEGRPWVHTYFFPAEQYERAHLDRLAEHCQRGWGEVEIHLHHGIQLPDTAENTRRQLLEFRDLLAVRHRCLSNLDDSPMPRYAFVHGNFALANSAGGRGCGVDSEMQILAETGCYADLTLPTGAFHPAQTAKINSLYECALPLSEPAPHRRGHDLRAGRRPSIFPLVVQGPLMVDFTRSPRSRFGRVENGAITAPNPPTLHRVRLWKRAAIAVGGRPDWLFLKLHCHSMDTTQQESLVGEPMRQFLRELVRGAEDRAEILHFVTVREMTNIILAACDGRAGNPGDYRDYRLRLISGSKPALAEPHTSQVTVKA